MVGVLFWLCVFSVFYVYMGYPVVIYLLSKIIKRPLRPEYRQPYVTLLFAAHNEEKVIKSKLENTLALDYPLGKFQILVVNDGSFDRTADVVRDFSGKGVELVDFTVRRGKLSALRDALEKVRGEIILFSDSDNFYPPDTITETVKYFSDSMVGAVSGGRNVIGDNPLGETEGLYWKYEEFIKNCESSINSCVGVAGDLLAVRKSLYVPPPPVVINDDFFTALLILKQGYRVIYAPEARSFHPVADSDKQEMERRARMVAGRYQAIFKFWSVLPWNSPLVVWQIVSHKYLRPFVPIFMVLALLFNVIALFSDHTNNALAWLHLAYPYNWLLLGLQILFYALALFGRVQKKKSLMGKLLYVPVFLLNSNLAALDGLIRYFASSQTVIWKKATR